MKTTACRLYGKKDFRMETFELPEIGDNEVLAKVISDSLCMSSYKAACLGPEHKRVPDNVAENPVILGHEFCGEIVKVGKACAGKYNVGDRFSIQPAMNHPSNIYAAPGYSFPNAGGDATYVIIPHETVEMDCLLKYNGDEFFFGSLAEPMSCVIGAFHASYHMDPGSYVHKMGIKPNGTCAILAGVGPMGLGAVDYALHGPVRPSLLVVTDINDARLERAASLYTPEDAAKDGIKLIYMNTSAPDSDEKLKALTGGEGFDDVFVFAPVKPVVEQADRLLGKGGCLNFFAGPTDPNFSASFNFYDVHYSAHHVCGTSGGNTDDMREALALMEQKKINPAAMVTHVGGLNAVCETTLNLPSIPGGKKLIYTHKNIPLTAIDDFAKEGETSPFFKALAEIVSRHNNLWCGEAEKYLLENAPEID